MKTMKHRWKQIKAFVFAVAILAVSIPVKTVRAVEDGISPAAGLKLEEVLDYTGLFPGVTSPKLKLSDPQFTQKDWYEYIEYEEYMDVKDGDTIFRIYKPTDYSAASIMAITDYNPKEVLGGTSSLTRNLGELQGILDMAEMGSNISKEFAGLDLATGIAERMNSINDVMDNSRFYSSSSFLGIPGDKKYIGVTNDGFFNADSLEIEIVETESVSVCKTIAMDSNYAIADNVLNQKDYSSHHEISEVNSQTHEESQYDETSNTSGSVVSVSDSNSVDNYHLITSNFLKQDLLEETIFNHTKDGSEFGMGAVDANLGATGLYQVEHEEGHDISRVTGFISESGTQSGAVCSQNHEDSIAANVEETNVKGGTSADSSTIEHGLTSGEDEGTTYQHANEMSVGVGYGVDYQYGNDHSLSVGVKRIFNARDEKEVKNVGWKLCEYVVKIPYYIEAIKTESDGTERVLYGQYVNYNLLNGISRVFANGYIEHWYTGELVTYADFFDGFITATELVEKAKEQQAAKVPKEGE